MCPPSPRLRSPHEARYPQAGTPRTRWRPGTTRDGGQPPYVTLFLGRRGNSGAHPPPGLRTRGSAPGPLRATQTWLCTASPTAGPLRAELCGVNGAAGRARAPQACREQQPGDRANNGKSPGSGEQRAAALTGQPVPMGDTKGPEPGPGRRRFCPTDKARHDDQAEPVRTGHRHAPDTDLDVHTRFFTHARHQTEPCHVCASLMVPPGKGCCGEETHGAGGGGAQ